MAIDLLEQILPHIKNSIYTAREALIDWKMKEGESINAQSPNLIDKSWTPIRIPFQWGKYNKTYWFRQKIKITEPYAGKPIVLKLDFSEALLFVNGKPFYGIDKNHNEVLLSEKAKIDEEFVIAVQAYSGRKNENNIFSTAEIAVLDPIARRLYNAITALQELDKLMEHGSYESKEIKELIRRTLIFLKYFKPGSEEYPNAIRRGYNFLINTLENEIRTSIQGQVHLIAHSHIDTAWLWTIDETKRKCGRTFSTILRLMEEFPEFKFSQGQALFYEFVKENYPDIYKEIKQRIIEGRWEPLGALWTETDCNIPNGESLIRQILYAKQFLRKEFNIDSNIAWLPDSFGFNAALPQIFLKSGINYFYTSKLTWNDTNQFPYTSFWWQGIDKSKILSYISQIGLEGQLTPEFLYKNIDIIQKYPVVPITLQTFGYGDGGGGPTKQEIENAVVIKNIVGLPSSNISSVNTFFKSIEEKSAELPVWNNELYLETHRGTYTTNAWVKRQNRICENLLYNAELLSVISSIFGKGAKAKKYPKQEIEKTWKKLLINQSHDIICGTAIADVYRDTERDYEIINNTCSTIIQNSINSISENQKKSKKIFYFTIFNTLGWERNEYVELSINSNAKGLEVKDANGNTIEYQVLERTKKGQRILCHVENIPPFGAKNIVISTNDTSKKVSNLWKQSSHSLETPLYKIRFDNKGAFSSIYSKLLKRELIQKGKRANQILTFKDIPKQWEAWNIEPEAEKHKLDVWQLKKIKIIENGPIRATILIILKSENGSQLAQHIRFYHKNPRVDFETAVEWHENNVLMKTAFQINIKTHTATYEIPFGAIERSVKQNTDFERARYEVPAQKWADISDAKFGVSILNNCKYGYDTKENILRLTLLRANHHPDPLEPNHTSEEAIEKVEHKFCYSMLPHIGNWKKSDTIQQAQQLNAPVIIIPNVHINVNQPILMSSKQNIIISAIKKSESDDAIIARLYEATGEQTDTTLYFDMGVKDVFECNLMECVEKEIKCRNSKIQLKFKPYEIKTIKFITKQKKRRK